MLNKIKKIDPEFSRYKEQITKFLNLRAVQKDQTKDTPWEQTFILSFLP